MTAEQTSPCEVVLDYARDAVVFDGADLPFSLSAVVAKAIVEDGRAVVTLTLEVDQVRSVAAMPEKPEKPETPEAPAVPSPEQQFESQLDRIRNGARRG